MKLLNTEAKDMAKIKHLFVSPEKGEVVEKESWTRFMDWFTPLSPTEEMYQTGGSSTLSNVGGGYEMENIVASVSPLWFHNYMSSQEAQDLLKDKGEGAFLIRFSTTNPGSYALSVAYSDTVGHWRISCEKENFKPPLYKIDGKGYPSLDSIVSKHKPGPAGTPLKIKQPKQGQPSTCYLGTQLDRNVITADQLYQNM